ncbi:MAG: DUF3017 domain-containing protein [Actinomycetaceae bacterium]|nr:DUF3017 domain-containing protein [Actinomycetaceae bacterium]
MSSIRVPAGVVYIGLALWIAAVVGSAYVWSAVVACRILAGSLVALALARAILPTGYVPRARSRGFDVVAYVALAGALWYLSTWAGTPLVALAA